MYCHVINKINVIIITELHLKPEPLMVSRVPPAVPPRCGDTWETTGVRAAR